MSGDRSVNYSKAVILLSVILVVLSLIAFVVSSALGIFADFFGYLVFSSLTQVMWMALLPVSILYVAIVLLCAGLTIFVVQELRSLQSNFTLLSQELAAVNRDSQKYQMQTYPALRYLAFLLGALSMASFVVFLCCNIIFDLAMGNLIYIACVIGAVFCIAVTLLAGKLNAYAVKNIRDIESFKKYEALKARKDIDDRLRKDLKNDDERYSLIEDRQTNVDRLLNRILSAVTGDDERLSKFDNLRALVNELLACHREYQETYYAVKRYAYYNEKTLNEEGQFNNQLFVSRITAFDKFFIRNMPSFFFNDGFAPGLRESVINIQDAVKHEEIRQKSAEKIMTYQSFAITALQLLQHDIMSMKFCINTFMGKDIFTQDGALLCDENMALNNEMLAMLESNAKSLVDDSFKKFYEVYQCSSSRYVAEFTRRSVAATVAVGLRDEDNVPYIRHQSLVPFSRNLIAYMRYLYSIERVSFVTYLPFMTFMFEHNLFGFLHALSVSSDMIHAIHTSNMQELNQMFMLNVNSASDSFARILSSGSNNQMDMRNLLYNKFYNCGHGHDDAKDLSFVCLVDAGINFYAGYCRSVFRRSIAAIILPAILLHSQSINLNLKFMSQLQTLDVDKPYIPMTLEYMDKLTGAVKGDFNWLKDGTESLTKLMSESDADDLSCVEGFENINKDKSYLCDNLYPPGFTVAGVMRKYQVIGQNDKPFDADVDCCGVHSIDSYFKKYVPFDTLGGPESDLMVEIPSECVRGLVVAYVADVVWAVHHFYKLKNLLVHMLNALQDMSNDIYDLLGLRDVPSNEAIKVACKTLGQFRQTHISDKISLFEGVLEDVLPIFLGGLGSRDFLHSDTSIFQYISAKNYIADQSGSLPCIKLNALQSDTLNSLTLQNCAEKYFAFDVGVPRYPWYKLHLSHDLIKVNLSRMYYDIASVRFALLSMIAVIKEVACTVDNLQTLSADLCDNIKHIDAESDCGEGVADHKKYTCTNLFIQSVESLCVRLKESDKSCVGI